MNTETKYCTKCNRAKPIEDFHKGQNRHRCKDCCVMYYKNYKIFKNVMNLNGSLHTRKDDLNSKEIKEIQVLEDVAYETAVKSRSQCGRVSVVALIAATDDFLRVAQK